MTIMLAMLLPLALGALLWLAAMGRPRSAAGWTACLGSGYLLGALLTGVLLRWADAVPLSRWPAQLMPIAAVCVLVGAAGCAWWLRRRGSSGSNVSAPRGAATALDRVLPIALALLLLGHFVLVTGQALDLPTLSWDAWNTWLAKPRAWIGADMLRPAVDFGPWWASEPGSTVQVTAGIYPESVPRFAAWLAAAAGGWREPVVHLAWPLLWLALGGMLYGYLRLAGATTMVAALAAFAVLSLPLVNTHVVLAGYTDLWLAAGVLLAFVHLERAWRLRSRGDVALALLAVGLLPAIKVEGGVWLLCLLGAALLAAMPRSMVRIGPPLALLGVGVLMGLGGVPIPLPGSGVATLEWGAVTVPGKGVLELYWRPVGEEVLESLFVLPNWHLLWLALPIAALAGMRRAAGRGSLRPLAFALLLGYAFVFVLFFFTDASAWAENLTSVNRVLLQIVPATVFWVSLLYVGRPAPRGRWS